MTVTYLKKKNPKMSAYCGLGNAKLAREQRQLTESKDYQNTPNSRIDIILSLTF
jgi:hypothetical protein